jgi:hypothetical protein
MPVEQIGRVRERAGRPPGVVVAKGDVGRGGVAHAEVAAGAAEVACKRYHLHLRELALDADRRAVARCAIDDDDRRTLRQRRHARDRTQQLAEAVVRQYHHRDSMLRRLHRRAHTLPDQPGVKCQ